MTKSSGQRTVNILLEGTQYPYRLRMVMTQRCTLCQGYSVERPPEDLVEAAASSMARSVSGDVLSVYEVIAWDLRKRTAAVWFQANDDNDIAMRDSRHPPMTNPSVLLRRKLDQWIFLGGGGSSPMHEPDRRATLGGFGIPMGASVTHSIGTVKFLATPSCRRLVVEDRQILLGPSRCAIVIYSTPDKPAVEGFNEAGELLGSFHISNFWRDD